MGVLSADALCKRGRIGLGERPGPSVDSHLTLHRCKRVREYLVLRCGWPWDEDYGANNDLGFLANCVCVCVCMLGYSMPSCSFNSILWTQRLSLPY